MTIRTKYYFQSTSPDNNKVVGDWVSTVIWGEPERLAKYCTMAVLDDDKLIGGTVYHNYYQDEGVIELSSASVSKRWLTRPVIRAMFSLPFERLGCQLVVLRVSERNETMCKIARTFGFSEVYIPRLRGRDEGEFVFSFTDDQWMASKYREAV